MECDHAMGSRPTRALGRSRARQAPEGQSSQTSELKQQEPTAKQDTRAGNPTARCCSSIAIRSSALAEPSNQSKVGGSEAGNKR